MNEVSRQSIKARIIIPFHRLRLSFCVAVMHDAKNVTEVYPESKHRANTPRPAAWSRVHEADYDSEAEASSQPFTSQLMFLGKNQFTAS